MVAQRAIAGDEADFDASRSEAVGGRYTIERPLGAGGMAELSLARIEGVGGFEKRVVLKRLLPQLAQDQEFVQRFLQEARVVAALDHPNIAAVYDVGEHRGRYFFAMEYVEGRDLRQIARAARMQGRSLSVDEVVTVGMGLAGGLHYAHECVDADGAPLLLVHRDVSPANVLVSWQGAVKLVDFGIAKVRSSMVATAAGSLRGKIPYMSPEQARGQDVDRRSDIYSVGLVLWELLAGRRAVPDDNEIAMLRRVAIHRIARVDTVRPDCPKALAAIIARATRLDPDGRYPTAAALQADLEQLVADARLRCSASTLCALLAALHPDHGSNDRMAPSPCAEDETATYGPTQLGVDARNADVVTSSRRRWPWALVAGLAGAAAVALWGVEPEPEPVTPQATPVDTVAQPEPVVPIVPAVPVVVPTEAVQRSGTDEVEPSPSAVPRKRLRAPTRRKKRRREPAEPPTRDELDAPLPPEF